MTTATEKKSFGLAVVLWIFTGMVGGHRVYIREQPSALLWYWLAAFCSFGIVPIVGLFQIKGKIQEVNYAIDEKKRNDETYSYVRAQQFTQQNQTFSTSPSNVTHLTPSTAEERINADSVYEDASSNAVSNDSSSTSID